MTPLSNNEIISNDTFSAQANDTAGFLHDLKKNGWEKFSKIELPTRFDEKWRFSNLNHIKLESFSTPSVPLLKTQNEILEKSKILKNHAGKIIFTDGYLTGEIELKKELKDAGVIFETLENAAKSHPALLEKFLLKSDAILGSEKFLALHQAYLKTGYFLYVPKNVEIKDPIVVFNWSASDNTAIFPHSLIVTEENTRVNVVDFFLSENDTDAALSVAAADIYAAANSGVSRKIVQNWNEKMQSYQVDNTHAERDSFVTTVSVNLGGKRARFENAITINGTGANVRLYGLTVANKTQEFDQRTLQIHNAENATSDLLYKNALLDDARTIFSGLIRVAPGAQKTDAYQTNRNLLLSPEAEANSLPGLEIEANDVKCSHGATTGPLDTSELFYMQARGIPKDTAYELLVFGFFEEIIEKVENEELAEILRDFVQTKFVTKTKKEE